MIIVKVLAVIAGFYVLICVLLYFFQEKLIFMPERLPANFVFRFNEPFQEFPIRTNDGTVLSGLLFKANQSKGLIFYLHGNAGSLQDWGDVARTYLDFHYDVFLLDYRGYGKSEGTITSESELFEDVQVAYDRMKERYPEQEIVVLGYSIGTGMATKVASANHPGMLILQAPYYSLVDMMGQFYPFIPTVILKYRFRNDLNIRNCAMPIVIFHGDQDNVIDCSSSIRLKTLAKPTDTLILLRGQGHNGMTENRAYLKEMERILGAVES